MHPYILIDLARIRSESLIDEARRSALASQLRRQNVSRSRTGTASARSSIAAAPCGTCGRAPCGCPATS